MTTFNGKICIITGATAGIGLALARLLGAEGARLSLAARNQERLDTIVADLLNEGIDAIAIATDVRSESACRELIQKTVDHFGGIDCLFNNAGLTMLSRFDDLKDLVLFEDIIKANFLGSVYCTHYALPHLKASKGRIVAVSSISGFTGLPFRSAYSASKHAMVGFFDTLRLELIESEVSVTTVFPGFVKTEIRERAFDGEGNPIEKIFVNEAHSMSPEECASIILDATAKRKSSVVMTLRGKLGRYIKVLFPRLADSMVLRAIRKGI